MNNIYLSHHGIKGQKWGVRRYQKKDGSLTPAGKERYDDVSSVGKSKHRANLEAKYLSKGMSPYMAARKADNRIKTEQILGVIGGVAVAAAATYAITKYARGKTDQIIKSCDSAIKNAPNTASTGKNTMGTKIGSSFKAVGNAFTRKTSKSTPASSTLVDERVKRAIEFDKKLKSRDSWLYDPNFSMDPKANRANQKAEEQFIKMLRKYAKNGG